jgi:hypothetical protein
MVDHFGALCATDSFLRSRVTSFTQGLETLSFREDTFSAARE